MLFLKNWLNAILFLLLGLIVCNSENAGIQILNLKFDRLDRITNGLQRDVKDIWTVLSNITTVNFNKARQCSTNETDQSYSNVEKVLKRTNETISDVEELKSEVKELMVYAQNGLRNEKASSREAIQKIQKRQSEYEQLQQQSFENKLEVIMSNNAAYETEIATNKLNIIACFDKLETMGHSLEEFILDQVSLAKREIYKRLLTAACGDGWETFGTSCYYSSSNKLAWDDAWGFCQAKHSHLVEVEDEAEIKYLVDNFKSLVEIWVGSHDRYTKGIFRWQTSRKLIASEYFYPGEPNNEYGSEDCAELYLSTPHVLSDPGKINDKDCNTKLHFVCEKSINLYQ